MFCMKTMIYQNVLKANKHISKNIVLHFNKLFYQIVLGEIKPNYATQIDTKNL